MFFDRKQRKRITRAKSLLFLILFIYVLTVPAWVQASSGYFPNYDPPQYKPKIDPLKYQPPQLQPPDYEKIQWEKPDNQSISLEETLRNSLDPNTSGDDDQTTSTWEELVKLIRGQEGGFFHEVMFVASAMVGALGVMGVKSAKASGGASAKGILGRLFRIGGLLTGGANLLRGAWSLWSSNKAKAAGVALAVVVLSGAGVYWYQQQFTQEPFKGYDAVAAKERYQYYLLSKMEDSATYIKLRYGDHPRGYYTDEQGILRNANGAIAWDFIGQYQERNPALLEELIYPTLEHGERVEYWGKKVAEWAYANNLDVTDALNVVSFVPKELEEEVFVNAIVQFNVKVGRENADAPEFGGAPIVVGSLKNTGKVATNLESATQTPTVSGSNSSSLASSKGTGESQLALPAGKSSSGSSLVIEHSPNPKVKFSESELRAANYMYEQGNQVVLRHPIGTRADGGTSDLLVNGVRYDVYTPTTSNLNRIISSMAGKNSQTTGIVLDLSKTTVTPEQLGNALQRVRGIVESGGKTPNITDIVILP